jgi:hypothetical protein
VQQVGPVELDRAQETACAGQIAQGAKQGKGAGSTLIEGMMFVLLSS